MRLALLHAEFGWIEALVSALEAEGHHVHRYQDSRTLILQAARESFDLFLLEWGARGARQVLQDLRGGSGIHSSVIFFNCSNSESELADILGSGADDFITGPVGMRELVARAGAVMRRRNPGHYCRLNVLDMPPYRFDTSAKVLLVDGVPVALTEKEFELAVFLFRNLGRTLSRGHLLEAVWGSALLAVSRTVDTHISRIRRKLGLRPEVGFRLSAAYGNGYRLERVVEDWKVGHPSNGSGVARPGERAPVGKGRLGDAVRAS